MELNKVDYFISYSSKDTELAKAIVDAIEEAGKTCWIAYRNIPYGTPYARAIMQGIDGCEKFMVLITDNSISSEDVLNEVDNAHAAKKVIIPVKLTDKRLPRELNYYLSRTQWLSLDHKSPRKIAVLLGLKKDGSTQTETKSRGEHSRLLTILQVAAETVPEISRKVPQLRKKKEKLTSYMRKLLSDKPGEGEKSES